MKKIIILSAKVIFVLAVVVSTIILASYTHTRLLKTAQYYNKKEIDMDTIKLVTVKIINKLDRINPFINKTSLSFFDYPEINISLNKKNLNVMKQTLDNAKKFGFMHKEVVGNKYTKIKLLYKNKKYKAKIKFHGNQTRNYINKKRSFRIKMNKDNLFENIRTFSLIIVEDASISTIFSYKLYELLTGFKINAYLVKLKINGVEQGLYLFEEKLDKYSLEKNLYSGVDIIKPMDLYTSQYNKGHQIPYSFHPAYTELNDISNKPTGQLVRYEKLFNTDNYNELARLVNIDKTAKFEAMRALFNNPNISIGDNIRLLYDISNGKFFPFFRAESILKRIVFDHDSITTFDQYLYSIYSYYNNSLYLNLIKNDIFREYRNRYLFDILKDKNKIINLYEDIYNEYHKAILSDPTIFRGGRITAYEEKIKLDNLKFNINAIENYLSYARAVVVMNKIKNNVFILDISADSNSPIVLKNLELLDEKLNILKDRTINVQDMQTNRSATLFLKNIKDFFIKEKYTLSLDNKLYPHLKNKKYKIKILDKDINVSGFRINFNNDITNKPLKKSDIFQTFINLNKKILDYPNIVEFLSRYKNLNLHVNDKTIYTNEGSYTIDKDLILPHGYNLVLKQGTTLKLAPNKSVLVYGNLSIKGTKQKPVIIKNLVKDKPFGVIGAVGDSKSNIDINYLNLSGGNEATINGIYLSGGLSLYSHKKVTVKNSHVHHNSADDGLNIKNAEVLLENNIFNANSADQVDLDSCNGYVRDNRFISDGIVKDFNWVSIPEDDNGDGLDFSGSKAIVKGNNFDGFLDKGISVGEKTKALIAGNKFTNNRSAVTAKDQSDVYMLNNIYADNRLNLEMYQKKKIFSSPSVYNINEEYNNTKVTKTNKSHYYKLDKSALGKVIEVINTLEPIAVLDNLKQSEWIEYE